MANTDSDTSSSESVYCTNCGEEILANSKFCPECGLERGVDQTPKSEPNLEDRTGTDSDGFYSLPGIDRNNTSRRNVLVGSGYAFGGLVLLGALFGDSDSASNDTTGEAGGSNRNVNQGSTDLESEYPNAWAIDPDTEIVLQSVEGSVGQFSIEITGEAINASDKDYSYVQLQFGLYDSTDAKVGDALANTSGLSAGRRWRFEAIGTESGGTESFRLESVSAY
jgi:hypothetical protein